jgi:hypothetical protein
MRNPTSPRPRGGARGAAGAVCAVHAAGPARHLPGEELAGGIHPQPVREDVPVGEHRKLPAGAAHAQAAPMEPPEDPLALLPRVHPDSLLNPPEVRDFVRGPRKDTEVQRYIKQIVIHHNAGTLTTETCWQSRAASAHYQIEADGTVGQLVYDSYTTWHAGNWYENLDSI